MTDMTDRQTDRQTKIKGVISKISEKSFKNFAHNTSPFVKDCGLNQGHPTGSQWPVHSTESQLDSCQMRFRRVKACIALHLQFVFRAHEHYQTCVQSHNGYCPKINRVHNEGLKNVFNYICGEGFHSKFSSKRSHHSFLCKYFFIKFVAGNLITQMFIIVF